MTNHSAILKGTIRGRLIELEHAPGLPDGSRVAITLHPSPSPGEGLKRAFGTWADATDELDRFLKDVHRDRTQARPEIAE
jgi:hypothetical protein